MRHVIETAVGSVREGDEIISPFSKREMQVIRIEDGMYGLLQLTCVDADHDRHLLSLDPAEKLSRIA